MPFTQSQVRLFLSDASPLNATQQEKLKGELHASPEIGHRKPGPEAGDASRKLYARYKSARRPGNG